MSMTALMHKYHVYKTSYGSACVVLANFKIRKLINVINSSFPFSMKINIESKRAAS